MGWQIGTHKAKDPLKVPKAGQKRVSEWLEENGWEASFNKRDELSIQLENEHQPFYEEGFIALLIEGGAKGDFLFGSMDGDDSGSNWGYRYRGDGTWCTLKAELAWREAE